MKGARVYNTSFITSEVSIVRRRLMAVEQASMSAASCPRSLSLLLAFLLTFFFLGGGLSLLLAVFTLDARLLVRSQYSEGPATGHLDKGFSWFPCVYKQMLTDGSQDSKLPLHASHMKWCGMELRPPL